MEARAIKTAYMEPYAEVNDRSHDNVVAMPGVTLNHPNDYTPTEVFAIKRMEDIHALQEHFLAAKDYRDWLYVVMGINLGLRASDMIKLRWNDIFNVDGSFKSQEQSVVKEKKTGKYRYLVLNDDIKTAVRWYLKTTGIKPDYNDEHKLDYWVFPKFKSNPQHNDELHIARVHVGRILKKAAEEVGIPYRVSTHSLRKTFGYRLYKAGVPIEYIARIFNHSAVSITLRYIGIMNDEIATYIGNLDSVLCELDGNDRED